MTILDAQLQLSAAQAVTASAVSAKPLTSAPAAILVLVPNCLRWLVLIPLQPLRALQPSVSRLSPR
jgi:hypothetical protein